MPHQRKLLTELIPDHLKPLIAVQRPEDYSARDHAAWRYILRISRAYFSERAHAKYLQGLEQTGISTERIPLVSEMDEKLRRFGWRAVPVSGFIPPSAFMEFQSLGILPIACEMRTLDHIAYTPAPDIVHEAAGHAPILADPEYAAYLREYGEVSRKAIFSHQDLSLFEAIRELSDLKEDPKATKADIDRAQATLDQTSRAMTGVSEAALLARMTWWTVEYGLVGSIDDPKIYGAGLLSSVGESYSCLGAHVRKVPFSLNCIETSYDITRPQPQLFVTPSFEQLTAVLEEFTPRMAYRLGGAQALAIARESQTVTTTVLDSGVQLSGVLAEFREHSGRVAFVRYAGPVQIACGDRELPLQGAQVHAQGFSSPLGAFRGSLESGQLEFESGIHVQGKFLRKQVVEGTPLTATFEECTIEWRHADGSVELLYRPDWGTFDLVLGQSVVSVFGGAADRAAYLRATGDLKIPRQKLRAESSEQEIQVHQAYQVIREQRESGRPDLSALEHSWRKIADLDSSDWLAAMELLELECSAQSTTSLRPQLLERLKTIGEKRHDLATVIERGLRLLGLTLFPDVTPGAPLR